jgi:hypothetical protein
MKTMMGHSPMTCVVTVKGRPYRAIVDSGNTSNILGTEIDRMMRLEIQEDHRCGIHGLGSNLTAVGLITDVPVKIQGKTFSGPVQQRC